MTDSQTIQQLRTRLAEYQSDRARRAGWLRKFIPTGLIPLDRALPHGGLPCGAITELLSPHPGMGAMTLAFRIARRASAAAARTLIVIDVNGHFYPPAAAPYGIHPQKIIVIRTADRRDAFWVMDQTLRCPGIAAVLAFLPDLDERQSRRLQLAAEVTGSIGLLLGGRQQKSRSFAAVRMLLQPAADSSESRPSTSFAPSSLCRLPVGASSLRRFVVSVSLLSVREGMPSDPFLLDLYHATGTCDLPALPLDRSTTRIA